MAVQAKCPKCESLLSLPETSAGGRVVCPSCGAKLALRLPPAPKSAQPPAGATAPSSTGAGAPPPVPALAPGTAPAAPVAGPAGQPPRRPATSWRTSQLLTAGAAAAVVLVVGLIVAAVLLRGGSSSSWKYLPHDSKAVVVLNVQQLLNSDLFRQSIGDSDGFKEFQGKFLQNVGLNLNDISRVLMATNQVDRQSGERFIFVVECARDVQRDEVLQAARRKEGAYQEEKAGEAVIYVANDLAFHFPDARTVVVGTLPTVRAGLAPDRPMGLQAEMQEMVDSLNLSRSLAVAAVAPSQLPGMPAAGPGAPNLAQQVRGITFHADFTSDIRMEATLFCKDKEAAESMRKMIEGTLELAKQNRDMPANLRGVVNSVTIQSSGSELRGSATVPGKLVEDAVAGGLPRTPFGR